jgi:signal transduction histidine kinase
MKQALTARAQFTTVRRLWPRPGLRGKLILGLLLVLVPVLGVLLDGFQMDYERRREAILDSLTQTAQAVAALADASFDDALALAQALASDPLVQAAEPEGVAAYLEQVANSYPQILAIVVVDPAGQQRGATDWPAAVPAGLVEPAFVAQVLAAGRPVLSEVLVGAVQPEPMVLAAAPVADPHGHPAGVVLVALGLDVLAGRLERVTLAPDQDIFLVSPTGGLVYQHRYPDLPGDVLRRDRSGVPEVQAARAGQVVRTLAYHSPAAGDVRAAAVVPSPEHGWVVGVSWPVEQALAPVEQAHRREGLAFLGVVLAALMGAGLLAQYIARPVRRLAAHAEAVGRGELERRVAIRTGDELESLGEAFNRMAEALAAEREQQERFIRAVAHDQGSPLSVVRGYADLLRRSPEAAELRERAAAGISKSVGRLERLRGDLLDWSRLASGRFVVDPRPMDLMALLRELVEAMRAATPGHAVQLEGPAVLRGEWDSDRMAQVGGNLIGNAIKYSPAGSLVRVVVEPREGEVHLRVTDQGPGLASEDVERVFAPFQRLERTRSVEGMGLGLSICKAIVEAHGGRIWAESAGLGTGSSFHLALPLGRPGTARTASAAAVPEGASPVRAAIGAGSVCAARAE